MRILLLTAVVVIFASCRSTNPSTIAAAPIIDSPAPPNVVPALKQYCKSCHAIFPWKFLPAENNDDEIWANLFTHKVPTKQYTWAVAITKVLDWPNGLPPTQSALMESTVHWMPLGINRIKLHEGLIAGESARVYILKEVKQELQAQAAHNANVE